MIVAIIAAGSGSVRVEEFREAASVASAVDAFCSEYDPPRQGSAYVGFETGWSAYQYPGAGKRWEYDFSSEQLVQVSKPAFSLSPSDPSEYIEEAYSSANQLVRRSVFGAASGWVFGNKIKETTYEWAGNRLMSGTTKIYDGYGAELSSVTESYSTDVVNGQKIVRRARQ